MGNWVYCCGPTYFAQLEMACSRTLRPMEKSLWNFHLKISFILTKLLLLSSESSVVSLWNNHSCILSSAWETVEERESYQAQAAIMAVQDATRLVHFRNGKEVQDSKSNSTIQTDNSNLLGWQSAFRSNFQDARSFCLLSPTGVMGWGPALMTIWAEGTVLHCTDVCFSHWSPPLATQFLQINEILYTLHLLTGTPICTSDKQVTNSVNVNLFTHSGIESSDLPIQTLTDRSQTLLVVAASYLQLISVVHCPGNFAEKENSNRNTPIPQTPLIPVRHFETLGWSHDKSHMMRDEQWRSHCLRPPAEAKNFSKSKLLNAPKELAVLCVCVCVCVCVCAPFHFEDIFVGGGGKLHWLTTTSAMMFHLLSYPSHSTTSHPSSGTAGHTDLKLGWSSSSRPVPVTNHLLFGVIQMLS